MTLAAALGAANILLGLVYTEYGTMTLVEMVRNRATMGFSHFGAAWVAMAFTCGPHHWVHGVHLVAEGRAAGPLELAAVLVGLPAGIIWFSLRVEAFLGGRGDRFVAGNPGWILALPTAAGVYVGAIVSAALIAGDQTPAAGELTPVAANLILVGLYLMVGYYLLRTQLANHKPLGGWSASGLALAVILPTCAVMHAVYAFYSLNGRYAPDYHGLVVDWIAVPAAMYFLWVVHALYKGSFRDWNGVPTGGPPALARAAGTQPAGLTAAGEGGGRTR